MNNSHQAKNGFKTFLVTLIISLGVFAAVYYLTSYPTYQVDIEESTGGSVGRVESERDEKLAMNKEENSPFGDLKDTDINVPRRAVLAGADTAEEESFQETTESTVPDTGMFGMTLSLFISLLILSMGIYYVYLGPRSLALRDFEDRFLN